MQTDVAPLAQSSLKFALAQQSMKRRLLSEKQITGILKEHEAGARCRAESYRRLKEAFGMSERRACK